MAQTHKVVVVEQQSQLVAFAALDAENCILSQLFVSPDWKRKGIGGQLVQWVSSQCPDGFSLKTAADNEESRAFYEKLGLVEVSRSINDFNGRQEVVDAKAGDRSGLG